jgi:hypothetical protein
LSAAGPGIAHADQRVRASTGQACKPFLLSPSHAAPAAAGASTLTGTSLIQRGYENLIPKLHALGAEVVEAE